MKKKKTNFLLRLASWPIFSGIAAVVAILAGALASFFTDSIRTSLGLPSNPSTGDGFAWANFHVTPEASVFWGLLFVAIFMFALSKASDAGGARANHSEIAELVERLHSLPGDDFLTNYQEVFQAATDYSSMAILRGESNIEQIDSSVRALLAAIVKLALVYDEVGKDDVRYAANVMLFGREWDRSALAVACDVEHLTQEAHSGVLRTFVELSTSSVDLDKPDERLGRLCLPVHKREDHRKGRVNILPGAPEAYVNGSICLYSSQEIFFQDLENKVADSNQAESIKRYFVEGGGKDIQGFVCIPIPKVGVADSSPGDSSCAGVLNIHSNKAELLRRGSERFVPIVIPLVYQISLLLVLRAAAIQ